MVCHHPPVAAGRKGARVVLHCHCLQRRGAGCDGSKVALVLVHIAVFMGDACAADGVRSVVLDFDECCAFGEA